MQHSALLGGNSVEHPNPLIPRLAHQLVFVVTLALACATLSSANGSVVINEIMYQPAGFPENPMAEYIELSNTSLFDADISGWQFTKGVSFVFPSGTVIPPNGYLVVAANLATFQSAHPGVSNAIGNWTGSLSNISEELKLVNSAGVTQDCDALTSTDCRAIVVRAAPEKANCNLTNSASGNSARDGADYPAAQKSLMFKVYGRGV